MILKRRPEKQAGQQYAAFLGFGTVRKAWQILDKRERRGALLVTCALMVAAGFSALMVGSVIPFLSVLADPERIRTVPLLAWAYTAFGFESDYTFLVALGSSTLVIIVIASTVEIARAWAISRFAYRRIHTLSYRLLAVYLSQRYEFFLKRDSSEMSTRILAETREVVDRFFRPVADLVAAIFTVAAITIIVLWVDPVVALILFGVLGTIYGIVLRVTRRLIARAGLVRTEANEARYRIAQEALRGAKDIKLLGVEASYINRFRYPSEQMAQSVMVVEVLAVVPHYLLQGVGFSAVVIICLALLEPSGLTNGSALSGLLPLLGVFAFAGQRIMPELTKIYRGLSQANYAKSAVDALYFDLIREPEVENLAREAAEPLGMKHELSLEGVSYRYPGASSPALHNISLTIKAGNKIGIVGGSGAGKTTLADIVLGLLRPSSGSLTADGTKITMANLRAWQRTVGYVPQNIFLADATIAENIALGVALAEIDDAKVQRAARVACLDAFVVRHLPHGYYTRIGEQGVRLSGGQRQRIGIARAVYNDADLIVLDEATSALDNLTEKEVIDAMEALPGDKAVVMIAHRLSTIRRCDRIIVLESGRIVGCDCWEQLMVSNPSFRRLAALAEVS